MEVQLKISLTQLARHLRRLRVWLLIVLFGLITILQYGDAIGFLTPLAQLRASLGLERHSFERILYLVPIIWAGFLFARRGAFITSLIALACMLPQAIFLSLYPKDALLEAGAVFFLGNLVAFSFHWFLKEQERRVQLSARTSSVVSQSLDLNQILQSSLDNVIEVLKVDAALVFLVDAPRNELVFTAHKGVSGQFAQGVSRLKVGEGFNGRVAATGQALLVDDASQDPALTRIAVKKEGIRSQLIVPLKSKGTVVGTLCVAMRRRRHFRQDEVELLVAIGNQIGVAVENARLYEKERQIVEQLSASEATCRGLFEGANDAIWIEDVEGNIHSVNKAAERLSGYKIEELRGMNVSSLLDEVGLYIARQVCRSLLKGEPVDQPYEQRLIRRDGREAICMLTTSLVTADGQPACFQHIARDVTEEKRMRENLSFYLEQVTRAQEEERKRMARELHDETIQSLVVLSRQLDDLASSGNGLSNDNRFRLETLRQQTNSIIDGVRRLCQDLRPATLDRLGLLPALEWLASEVGKHSGVAIEVKIQGAERRLGTEAELLLFRIVQEALRNVWRHSQATRAEVSVEFNEGKVRIAVRDDGKGFGLPPSVGGLARDGKLGLAGMQERARLLGGSLKVESDPGQGTTITIETPI